MVRVLALVEGPTERNFGQRVLAPHLGSLGIAYCPRVRGKPGHKGGVGPWDRARRELSALIRQEPSSVVTTMFDLYALPIDWPGRQDAMQSGMKSHAAAAFIEKKIAESVLAEFRSAGFKLRFVPYLSLHEFESLLFSDPAVLASVTHGAGHLAAFQAILEQCGECELINDGPETAPSKRILQAAPGYTKTVDGITVAQRIGLPTIRSRCPHFGEWIDRLEQFGEASEHAPS